jgi:hypothetical protein
VLDNDEESMIATYHHGESGYLLLDVEVLGAYDESGELYLEENVNKDVFGVVINEGDMESFIEIVDSSSSGESDVDSDVQEINMEPVDVDVITVRSDDSEDSEDEFEIVS